MTVMVEREQKTSLPQVEDELHEPIPGQLDIFDSEPKPSMEAPDESLIMAQAAQLEQSIAVASMALGASMV
ncbi:MAG: hypothetical protein J2P17_28500, partial [Mycobacterium sp.]|nr:hypothetical protein [Mycobacterium sp.]